MMERLGILGGTFDPIHYGHLALAEEARVVAGLSRILFIPAARQPHKAHGHAATPQQRLDMVRIATAGNPSFLVSSIEIERAGPSYTVDTLEQLNATMQGEFFFILGIDVLADLPRWRAAERVVALARMIAVGRPGATLDTDALLAALPGLRERLTMIDGPGMALSSSSVRRRIAEGLPIRYLTPDPVTEYIAVHGLYRRAAEAETL
jgi:nicotinate-nucleotide adenylyltransferase